MRRKTTKEFIEEAIKIHGDKYDYSKVKYINAYTNVSIICAKYGIFEQAPSNHLRGAGCKICNKIDKRRKPIEDLLEQCYHIHGNKYDYSKIKYINNKTKVEIICPKHGSFYQDMDHHLRGHGCPNCAVNKKDTLKSFIKKARKIHGDLYAYSNVEYVDSQTPIEIIDPKYGSFYQRPDSHLNGKGCWDRRSDKITKTKKIRGTICSSSIEIKAHKILNLYFGEEDVIYQYKSEEYPFWCDFYIKSLDLYIEFNAFFVHGNHFYNPKCKDDLLRRDILLKKSKDSQLYKTALDTWTKKDLLKRDTAIKNNLNYLVFWDYKLSDFLQWLDNFEDKPILNNL